MLCCCKDPESPPPTKKQQQRKPATSQPTSSRNNNHHHHKKGSKPVDHNAILLSEKKSALPLSKMAAAQLESLVQRLERVTAKLEGAAAGGAAGSAAANDDMPMFVDDFEEIYKKGAFKAFKDNADECGDDAAKIGQMLDNAFAECLKFLRLAGSYNTPDQATLQAALKPLSEVITTAQNYRETNRKSKQFNHLSAVSEAIPALGWVAVAPKPAVYVKQMEESAQFYTNKLLKEFRQTDPKQANFGTTLIKLLKDLEAYIKDHHNAGLIWNREKPKLAIADLGKATGAPAPPAGGAPPPPPPPAVLPPAPAAADTGSGGDEVTQALFADLNKGTDVTKGLKKVTDDMKTHKNPALRTGPQPFKASPHSSPKPFVAAKPGAAPKAAPAKPPTCALQGKKWVIEYQSGNNNLVISETNMKQTVYIYRCENSTVQVKGKVNSIIVDGCKKTGIVCESVVSSVEFINSQSVKGQALGLVPTLSIDKTDGCQVYLSKESANAVEIVTAKSSEMNILVAKEDGEFKEFAIPEQFKTKFNGTKMVTAVSESLG